MANSESERPDPVPELVTIDRREVLRMLAGGALLLSTGGVLAGCGGGGLGADIGGGLIPPVTPPIVPPVTPPSSGGTDLPNIKLADQNTPIGANASESFTITKTTPIAYRFVPRYDAICAAITADQVAPFLAGQAFTGFCTNLRQGPGCGSLHLPAGTYYLGMRDATGKANSNNICHFEVDDTSGLSPSDGMHYAGELINSTAINLVVNDRYTNDFTILPNTRNFLFGCNTEGMDSYIITPDQKAAFRAGQSFKYLVGYNFPHENDQPYYEVKLSPGTYVLALANKTALPGSYAFEGQVWAFDSLATAARPANIVSSRNDAIATPQYVPALSPAAIANLRTSVGYSLNTIGVSR